MKAEPMTAGRGVGTGVDQGVDTGAVDAMVGRFMESFELPGVAVAVLTPAQSYVRGYGVRVLGQTAAVDVDTSFAIASTGKAFLAACLALLVDQGALSWDDPVQRHLPAFALHDRAAGAMMTVRDLLLHNSGLPLGAADLMQFPRTDHSAAEILAALRHFPPAAPFRSAYAYDNCLYLVAGMVLEKVAGMDWSSFVARRIFTPLGMHGAVGDPTLVVSANRAGRHARLGPPTIGMGPLEAIAADEAALIGPAGGINCSAAALLPWLRVQLGRGAADQHTRLWSTAQAEQMWQARTVISSGAGPTPDQPERSVLQAYALGWGVSDFRGRRMLSHGGGLAGQASRVTLLPEQGIGLALLSNSGDAEPVSALRYALLDHLLARSPAHLPNMAPHDWIGATRATIDAAHAQVHALLGDGDFSAPAGGPSLPLAAYAGRYRDAWYGGVDIVCESGALRIAFSRTASLRSVLEPFGADGFRTRFDRGVAEDAVLQCEVADGAVKRITLRALSPLADFSFDYQHLLLLPVAP